MLIVTVLPHTCELHQYFSVLVFGDLENRHFLSWQMAHLNCCLDWRTLLKDSWSQHQDWITVTYIINVYKSVFHVKRCETISRGRSTSTKNCTKKPPAARQRPLLQRRRVDAAFCQSGVPEAMTSTCPKPEWTFSSFFSFSFFYRPVVPMWQSYVI